MTKIKKLFFNTKLILELRMQICPNCCSYISFKIKKMKIFKSTFKVTLCILYKNNINKMLVQFS